MAIKAIINNTEKEIEQIKNSDEQDIDYVYSRIGDTEVEGELPISIKSIGGNLADYRIYGNTVDGESVGDRTGNLFDEEYENIPENLPIYEAIYVGDGYFTLSTTAPLNANSAANLFLMSGDVQTGASTATTGVWSGHNGTVESVNGYITVAYRYQYSVDPRNYKTMLNSGSTALPYEPYGYKVPVTVEGKNLLQNAATSQTINGVTFTVNSDGSVTCNGTSTSQYYSLFRIPCHLVAGNYTISGCPDGGSSGTYRADIRISPNGGMVGTMADLGAGATIPIDESGWYDYTIRIQGGYTVDDVTFKPMIRKADIEDDTYEPYRTPVTTPIYLPEQIKMVGSEAEYVDYAEQKMHRVRKNLINSSIYEIRNTGVEYTANNDKSITANGSTSSIFSLLLVKVYLAKGSYIISGCPQNGSQNTYRCEIRDMELSSLAQDTGAGVTYSIVTDGYYYYSIRIAQNYVCDNLTFYPMIRKADIEDDTYEPYIVNTEVNTTLPALSTIKGTNILSVNTSIQPSNIYIKDSFDYKKVFTATRTIEDELPLNYRNIEDNDSTLSNYRIYGNIVGGESVGDLVTSGEHAGEYKVPVTVSNGTDTLTTPIYLPEPIKMVGSEAEYIDYGEQKQHRVRKNLLPKITATYSKSGIILRSELDGTVIVNGTATARTFFTLRENISYPFDTILSGCPQGGSSGGYCLRVLTTGAISVVATDFGSGALIPSNTEVYLEIRIENGFECNNLEFTPMIRKADIEDDTYEPYIENVDLDVTLPALPTLLGTNVLSVGTAVQPSEVYIKGKIKEIN